MSKTNGKKEVRADLAKPAQPPTNHNGGSDVSIGQVQLQIAGGNIRKIGSFVPVAPGISF